MSAIFDDLLRSIQLQPVVLHRAQVKAAPRRFSGEPMTGFGDLYEADDEPGEDPRVQADRDREIDERGAS